MASGKIHKKRTLSFITVYPTPFWIGLIMFLITQKIESFFVGIGISYLSFFLGVYYYPDIDIPTSTLPKSYLKRNALILWYVYILFIYPYSKLVSHRDIISHFPFVSTVIRILYLFLWIFTIDIILFFSFGNFIVFNILQNFANQYPIAIWAFPVSLFIVDIAHWIDDLPSSSKFGIIRKWKNPFF